TDVVEELADPDQNWRVRIVGSLDGLPGLVAKRMRAAADRTRESSGTHVNVAIGYGGRQQIADAVRQLVRQEIAAGATGEVLVQSSTVNAIGQHLYASGHPDPDLVIRASGEQRLSGFLLWQ